MQAAPSISALLCLQIPTTFNFYFLFCLTCTLPASRFGRVSFCFKRRFLFKSVSPTLFLVPVSMSMFSTLRVLFFRLDPFQTTRLSFRRPCPTIGFLPFVIIQDDGFFHGSMFLSLYVWSNICQHFPSHIPLPVHCLLCRGCFSDELYQLPHYEPLRPHFGLPLSDQGVILPSTLADTMYSRTACRRCVMSLKPAGLRLSKASKEARFALDTFHYTIIVEAALPETLCP